MRYAESALQSSCKLWFDYQYPKLRLMFFAIPNAGARSKVTGGLLKRDGMVAGCPDIILLIARNGYGSLCIEFKTAIGRQSESQKLWQQSAEAAGNKYIICRNFDNFKSEIETYLGH